jgi:hypothetical protein
LFCSNSNNVFHTSCNKFIYQPSHLKVKFCFTLLWTSQGSVGLSEVPPLGVRQFWFFLLVRRQSTNFARIHCMFQSCVRIIWHLHLISQVTSNVYAYFQEQVFRFVPHFLVFLIDGCPKLSASFNYITTFQLWKAMKCLICCLSKSKFHHLVQFCGSFVQFYAELWYTCAVF